MVSEDDRRRIGIYGVNFLTPSFIGFLKNTPKISEVANKIPGLDKIASSANPYGAMLFGALDIAGRLSNKIKNNRFMRLSQLAGAGFYGVSTILDLFSIAEGDYTSSANLFFDASMAYQLGRDTADKYRGQDLVDDLIKW
jgi:hypothetical protein